MMDCRSLGVAGCRSRRGMRGLGDVCTEVDDTGACTWWAPSPAPVTTQPSASTSWLQNLIGGAVKTGENILTAKNQTRGILTQTAPGVFTYVQPEGSQVTLPVGTIGLPPASGSMGLVLVAGVGVLVVFMLMKGKG